MKIGIIDSDLLDNGTRHPNLALMKISAFYKKQGNEVKLLTEYNTIEEYDKVFISKVFSFTKIPIDLSKYQNIEIGGSGFFWDKAPSLPPEIEHHLPDYHLYDEYVQSEIERGIKPSYFLDYKDYSIGFVTRGCIRGCSFCINEHSKEVKTHAQVTEFLDNNRKYIYLWDDNFLASKDWKEILESLNTTKKHFQFRQGLDIRLLTDEKAEALSKSKYKGEFIFAFDNIADKDIIIRQIKLWKKHYTKKANTKLYVFCGFDRNEKYDANFWEQDIIDTFERIKILMQHGCIPYIMRHEKYEESPWKGIYITLARWANQPSFFKKESLREYVYITDGIGREDKQYASKRYLKEFENYYPDIAEMYYDLKYEEENQYRVD